MYIFIFIFSGNSLWKSNCKLDKNYKHKIVRRMRISAFNNLHILILLLSVKVLSHQMQQTLVSFYLSHFVSICTFLHLTIGILFISFIFHRYCVLGLEVKAFYNLKFSLNFSFSHLYQHFWEQTLY